MTGEFKSKIFSEGFNVSFYIDRCLSPHSTLNSVC